MRKELNDNMDDLLVKYLLDEATTQERRDVLEWITEKSVNQKYFEHFKLIWLRSKQLAVHSEVDENIAWARFKERVEENEVKVIPLKPSMFFRILRVAAAVVLIIGASWYGYLLSLRNTVSQQVSVYSGAQTLVDTLPDGSVITLNKNTTISYPEQFTAGKTREVILKGEAFFQVTPDKTKPFMIHANDVEVRVVGTSFNVKSTNEKTEIVVETGLVEVTKKEQKVRIKPEERVTAVKDEKLIKEKSDNNFYAYYRTKKLVCNDTPLWKLAEVLNESYRSHIIVSPEIKNLPINTTFEEKSLDEILNIISETFGITVVQKDGQIILK